MYLISISKFLVPFNGANFDTKIAQKNYFFSDLMQFFIFSKKSKGLDEV